VTDARRALLICAGLAVLHTWPLGALPWRYALTWHADAQLNGWIVAWIPHAIAIAPLHVFDGNIFAPETGTLAYSEPLIVPGLAGAPLIWLGVHPVIVLNLLTIAGLTATAWAAWLVGWRWTGSFGAAIVAAALVAFNVHLLTRLAHLSAVHAWGLPLTLYYADALVDRPSRGAVLRLAAVVAATAATSLYWLALAGVIAGVTVVVGARTRRTWTAAAAAALLGLTMAAPVLLPYVRLASTGVVRTIEMAREFSATLSGYLTSTSRVHQSWNGRIDNDVDVFFAGAAALLLAALGIVRGIAAGGASRRRAATLLLIAAAGVVLSLGPATSLYRVLYDWFAPLRGLRAAARFGLLYLIAIGVAAAFAVAAIETRMRSRSIWIAAAALVAVTVEAWHGPVRVERVTARPAIYRLLLDEPGPVVLVEAPFYPAHAIFQNGEYVLNSTLHFLPLMNGTSGYTPMSYRRRAESFWYFPRPWAIDAMRAEGATHVMVHLRRFDDEARAVEAALSGRTDLQLIAADPGGRRLYRFR
jgi:hypothetical protein